VHGGDKKYVRNVVRNTEKKRSLRRPWHKCRILLKCILRKYGWRVCTGLILPRRMTSDGLCEHGTCG
jgi:hypothetical protein